MADSMIQLSPDSTGKKVDTEELTIGLNSVHRERMQIAGDSPTDIAPVTAADGLLVNLGTNNDVTIAGGATLAEQQAQSALLTTIDADTSALAGAVAGSELQVDIVALPNEGQQTMANSISVAIASDQSAVPVSGTVAVTGSATLVEQQTQTTHLAAIETAVEILDNAIAGNEMQVDVVTSALPTGASTLAEQQAQTTHLATIAGDTTDIETAVELIDDTVATLGTSTYTEATTKGLVVGAVRRDADTTLVNTTNEVAPLQVDANGRLKVEVFSGETLPVSGTVAVTGVATEAKQDAEIVHLATIAGDTTAIETAVQIMDDWDETNRAAVNTIAGQVGVQGASGTVTALTQRVVLATDVGLPAGTSNIGDVDVLTLPAIPAGNNNIGDVDIASAPTGTSSIAVQGTAAHAAAAVGNPVYVGGRASTAVPTDVGADGDAAALWVNRNGLVVVSGIPGAGLNADPYTLLSETAQYTTTQTSAVLVAGGASERIVVTSIQIQAGATTAATVQVYFGTGAYARGTNFAIFDGEFAPSATLKPGFAQSPPSGYRSPTLGDDILVTTSAGITLTVTVWYYLLGV